MKRRHGSFGPGAYVAVSCVLTLILVSAFVAGCGRTYRSEQPTVVTTRLPVGLLVESEISGSILGQELREPRGLAVDRSGQVYVLDAGNARLVRLTESLEPSRETGGFGGQDGLFDQMEFIAVDNDLNLWITDSGNRRISRFNARLEFVEAVAFYDDTDPLRFGEPTGIGVTSYGEFWVADGTANRIAVFDNIGRFDRFIGGFGYRGGDLLEPAEIVRLRPDLFVVCDPGNGRLLQYSQYGDYERSIEDDRFVYPMAVTRQAEGIWWLLDGSTGEIHALDGANKVVLTVGPMLAGAQSELREPSDICLTTDGRVLVSDTGNNRLLVCRILFESP